MYVSSIPLSPAYRNFYLSRRCHIYLQIVNASLSLIASSVDIDMFKTSPEKLNTTSEVNKKTSS